MAVDGTYKIDIALPTGTQSLTVVLKTDGNALKMTSTDANGEQTSADGTVDGNDFAWSMDSHVPPNPPMKVECKGTVDGDDISGTLNVAGAGSMTFKGSRT